ALLVYAVTGASAFSLWGSNPLEHMAAEATHAKAPADPLGKFASLLRNGYSWTLQYEHRILADATLLAAAACAIGLLAVAVTRWRRGEVSVRSLVLAGGFPLIYPAVFTLAYSVSSASFTIMDSTTNAIEVRYAMPVVPFLLLPIGLAAARLFESGRRAAALCLLLPALALGAWGSLSTWSLDAMLHEPARRGFLWESFDGHFTWGALPPEERAGLQAATAGIADRQARAEATERYVVEHASPGRFVDLVRRCDDTAPWTWPLRYHAPVGSPPGSGPKAVARWLEGMAADVRPFAFASAASRLASEEDFQAMGAKALLHATRSPEELRTTLRGFGDGMFTLQHDGRVTLPRYYDQALVMARIAELPAWIDHGEAVFGLGFRVGRILHEWYPHGDPIMLRTLFALPKDLRGPFARGLGAGYRMRFLVPPPPDLCSPAVLRLTNKLTVELEAQFRAGLGGSETAR
ncbi:MAG TPA: hypothetical protein VK824_04835, partial [Planctomycetota bacterium]|nr:hypothetical protein [Planctomycetota bacterium]